MNTVKQDNRVKVVQYNFDRITPDQFEAALRQLEMNTTDFSFVTGTNERTVQRWIMGHQDIPPWVTLVCSLLTLPGAPSLARRVARAFYKRESKNG